MDNKRQKDTELLGKRDRELAEKKSTTENTEPQSRTPMRATGGRRSRPLVLTKKAAATQTR